MNELEILEKLFKNAKKVIYINFAYEKVNVFDVAKEFEIYGFIKELTYNINNTYYTKIYNKPTKQTTISFILVYNNFHVIAINFYISNKLEIGIRTSFKMNRQLFEKIVKKLYKEIENETYEYIVKNYLTILQLANRIN